MTIGPDVFEANGHIDWNASIHMARLGVVGIRAAEGIHVDTRYHAYKSELDTRGIPNFAYTLLRFEKTGPSPEEQAHLLLSVVGVQDVYTLTPVIDLEFPGGRAKYGISAGQALDWFLRCYTTVKAGLGGADPGVYTSEVVWVDTDGLNNLPCPEIAGAWSWMKYWPYPVGSPAVYDPATVNALPAPKVAPPFFGNWNLHQYQGDATGFPGTTTKVDMNRTHTVKLGDRNGTVAWIQKKAGVVVDGSFGPKTDTAVRQFQLANHLKVDGIVGLVTTSCLSRVVTA
jgi:peptidoglycan hydrolase-like protein with peptidoglycan-binding domain